MTAAAVAVSNHRRPGLTLYAYVARESLRPTLFALLGLTAVVLTTRILGYSDLVINRGLAAGEVGRMVLFEAVPVAARMFPFGVLVGCLVALGRLGADRELLVLEASGVAVARLVWPVVAFAGAMTTAALAVSLLLGPWASRSLDDQLAAISRDRPWAQIRAGAVSHFGDWQLEAREVSASGTDLRGVLLFVPELGETVFAQSGRVSATPEGAIDLTLAGGSVVLEPRGDLKYLRFETLRVRLPEGGDLLARSENDRLAGLPLDELWLRAQAFVPGEVDRLPRAALELQRRLALPLATLIFGLLAVPLFVTRTKYSRSGGGVLGLLATLAYYGLMQLGEGLVQAGFTGVALGAWLPNLVLAAAAGALLVRSLREHALGKSFERPGARRRRARAAERERRLRPRPLALARYVAGRFAQLVGLAFGVLFVAYLLIDVMDRLEWFARYGAGAGEILRFYGVRVPLLASRAVPMAILVAMALTVSLLAAEGELIGMRACGISSLRALAPALGIATLIAPAYFVLNNVVVPRTNALADEVKRTEIKGEYLAALAARSRAGVWFRSGRQVLEAARFDTDLGGARDLTIYQLGEDGLPVSREDAVSARHVGKGVWRLVEPSRVEIVGDRVRRVTPQRFAELGETLAAKVDTMHLSVAALAREIDEVEAGGYDATAFRVDYHAKLAEPLACVLLPAVVMFFAVTGPPFPGPAQTLLVSGIVGVAWILFSGVSASLGYGGALPPALGGWGPALVFGSLAAGFGVRLWRRR
jgi:LPS export ABC transporter permease LptG/LPS export ABC transporter permease LptF